MTRAQAAWTYLTGLFLVAGVVLLIFRPEATPGAVVCLTVAITGWLMVAIMLLVDRRAV